MKNMKKKIKEMEDQKKNDLDYIKACLKLGEDFLLQEFPIFNAPYMYFYYYGEEDGKKFIGKKICSNKQLIEILKTNKYDVIGVG